jgi:hypothetical protein
MKSCTSSCLGVLLAFVVSPAFAQFFSGAQLREEVQLVATVKSTSLEAMKSGHLMGYLEGLADAQALNKSRGAKVSRDIYSFCLPDPYTVEDLREAVKVYLARHSEPFIDKAPALAVIAVAFGEAFPCPRK